ncbi:MAG: hypothetical protein IPM94_08245 [bacterium]|nr:hypothetical protein [bacterium]
MFAISVSAVFLLASACLPTAWTACNWHKNGDAFYTEHQTNTLQNYSGPRFAELALPPGELQVLQDNVKAALAESPAYAMSRRIWKTADQLRLANEYQMYRLVDAANRATIAANPGEFRNSKLPCREWSFWMFATLSAAAVFDENGCMRHGMAVRTLVNVLLIAEAGIVLLWITRAAPLARRRPPGKLGPDCPGSS